MMKAPLYNLIFVTALVLYGTASYAQDLTVNFDATVEETTCAMTVRSLGSAAASGTSNDGYILTVPEMTVLDIVNQTSKAEGSFTLLPTECNNEITSIIMSISGNTNAGNSYFIDNDSSVSGYAENVSMAFIPKGGTDGQRIKLDGTQNVTWSSDQITNGMDLSVQFRRMTSTTPVAGTFQANATFSFTYR
ncbi:fimbrial protein [Citrobacter europaeus]|uniref:fimbrial protein n=1 Tax=Citrobacter europaeus TaxID=1914243 RepID=UPI00388E0BD5